MREDADDTDLVLFGPFVGRAILEVSFTALAGRLDPVRLLLIREAQKSTDFSIEKRLSIAINWQQDFKGEHKEDEDTNADPLKRSPHEWKPKDISRALLGNAYQNVLWKGAVQNLVDATPVHRGSIWMGNLRRIDPGKFAIRMRAEADKVYSACSKGVHHEFVIPHNALHDRATVEELLLRVFELASNLSLTANMCDTLLHPADFNVALDSYEEAQEDLS